MMKCEIIVSLTFFFLVLKLKQIHVSKENVLVKKTIKTMKSLYHIYLSEKLQPKMKITVRKIFSSKSNRT